MNFSDFYLRNARAFLATRQLSFNDLDEVARTQCDDVETTLLTSSAVHGFANDTSDVDVICIARSGVATGAMASQIHRGGNHLEVVLFTHDDVAAAFDALRHSAQLDGAALLDVYLAWDRTYRVSRKYLERIIAGVATDEHVPFFDQQQALSRMGSLASFDCCRQSAGFAALALRGGESRAAAGYALNALLYLMNALMCHHGWVVTNRKWLLERWRQRSSNPAGDVPDDLWLATDQLWSRCYAFAASRTRFSSSGQLEPLLALVERAEEALGHGAVYSTLRPRSHEIRSAQFLAGIDFGLKAGGEATLIPKSGVVHEAGTRPGELLATAAPLARELLVRARAGTLSFSLAGVQPEGTF